MKTPTYICPTCRAEFNERSLNEGPFRLCSECKKGILVDIEQYYAKLELAERAKHMHCRKCGHTASIKKFPLNGAQDDEWSERVCPCCHSESVVNFAQVPICKNCDEAVAKYIGQGQYDNCCSVCISEQEEYEAVQLEGTEKF